MTYKLLIIFVFVYILQFRILKKLYLFDKDSFKIAKVLNILVSLFIFWTITSDPINLFTLINDYDSFRDNIYIDTGAISSRLNFFFKLMSMMLDIVLFVVALNLSRRSQKYRKVFISILPIWMLCWTVDINRYFFIEYGSDSEYPNYIILLMFIVSLIRFLPFYFIYNSKVFKKMMCLDNYKIKEIVKGSAYKV